MERETGPERQSRDCKLAGDADFSIYRTYNSVHRADRGMSRLSDGQCGEAQGRRESGKRVIERYRFGRTY